MLAVLYFLVSLLAAGERLPSRDRDAVALQTKVVEKADLQYKDYKELPACTEGILNISGPYKVTSNRSFEGCLRVHGLEAVVHLLAPITFSGNTTFTGHIVVEGGGDLESACLVVKGAATLEGQLEFKRCINSAEGKNNDEAGKGGALRAEQVKLQGQVKFEGCFGRLGGAIYAETINVQDSMITASRCRAKEDGGVMYSEQNLVLNTSSLTVTNCSAERSGGVLLSKKQVVLDTSSLSATSCSAYAGGVIDSSENLVLNNSFLTAANCMAKDAGGVIYSRQNLVLNTSSLTATNCSAESWGGVIRSSQQVVLDTSSLSATSCFAYAGGVIESSENLVLNNSSLTAANCLAEGWGGVIKASKNLVLNKSTLTAANCSAKGDGGVIRSSQQVVLDTSSLTATSCSADAGGVIQASENVVLNTSTLTAANCSAKGDGGVMKASENVVLNNSSLTATNCSAEDSGGVIHSSELVLGTSSLSATSCSARYGGVIYSRQNLVLNTSSLTAANCSAKGDGGVLYSSKQVVLDTSSLTATSCSADAGGVIESSENVVLNTSSLTAAHCTAARRGGVIHSSEQVVLDASSLTATSCSADAGGVIYSRQNLVLNTSSLTATNCTAEGHGGVLCSLEQVVLDTSSLSATSCSAGVGGAISSKTNLTLNTSSLTATSCTSIGSGGALYASTMTALNSDMLVSSSTAGKSGGAAFVESTMTMAQSRVDIGNCSAGDTGGGLWMFDLIGDAVNMSNCSAAAMGGCIRVKQSLKLDEAVLAGCAASAGNAVASTGDVYIGNLSLLGGKAERSKDYILVAGPGSSLHLGTMTCDDTRECEVSSQKTAPQVASVARCPLGAGKEETSCSVSCIPCRPGAMLLQPAPDAACIPCPELVEECQLSHVKLQQGITVNTTNFSQVLHCPNPAACPAQVIMAPVPLDPPSYCQKGYEGPACSGCSSSSGYGRSDGSVLVCVECSTSTRQLVRHAVVYALKDVALFAIAAHGVLGAKAEKKNSAVYLNQLLAFATVSSTALTGVMQTSAFASLGRRTKQKLESIELFTDILQGQSGATMSMECLLAFAGKGLVFAHIASSLMPILLVLTLAIIKDSRASLVVGTNVFLAGTFFWIQSTHPLAHERLLARQFLSGFTSKFGKYLVAYRLQPQDQGGDLLTPFLPDVCGAFWWVLACITVCFALGAWSWTRMALSAEKPSPPHVLYLTQAYKPNCETWEVERLVRKMMLTLVSTVLPVTLSPALQMQFISAILLGSLTLYAHVRPYKEDDWNRLELRLLSCAVLITGFTTCLLANDSHWSRSIETQFALMFFIAAPAAIVCGTLAVLVAVEMYRERARQKEAEALEALNKASEN